MECAGGRTVRGGVFCRGAKGVEVCQSGVKCDPLTRFATAWQWSMDLHKTKGLTFL